MEAVADGAAIVLLGIGAFVVQATFGGQELGGKPGAVRGAEFKAGPIGLVIVPDFGEQVVVAIGGGERPQVAL